MNKLYVALATVGMIVATSLASNPATAQQPRPQYAAVLTVKHMCCAKESVPAIRELSRIPGVKRVAVDYKSRSLFIEQSDIVPSPQRLWDAAAQIKIEPVQLATPEGVYTSRPRR
jgi:copper chaperone CopZ